VSKECASNWNSADLPADHIGNLKVQAGFDSAAVFARGNSLTLAPLPEGEGFRKSLFGFRSLGASAHTTARCVLPVRHSMLATILVLQ
jgi:hypothetical protein